MNNTYIHLSPEWKDYFDGVLDNIGDTEYICYCYRDYDGENYRDIMTLIYDLNLDPNENVVAGEYPCITVYSDMTNDGCYSLTSTVKEIPSPSIAYGSYGSLSDLREGVGHYEAYAILFALGVSIVFNIVSSIFDTVLQLGKK